MAFLKELAILYRFFNLRISNKTTLLEISPNGAQNIFFHLNFCLILFQNAYILYKKTKCYVLNQCRSILMVPLKYTLEN